MRKRLMVVVVVVVVAASLGIFVLTRDSGSNKPSADAGGVATISVADCSGMPGPDADPNGDLIPPECLTGSGGLLNADINGDDVSDLVVGAPNEDIGGVVDAGAVFVYYGPDFTRPPDVFSQGSNGLADQAEAGDKFAFSLTSFDADCSGKPDIIVGVPFEDVTVGGTTVKDAGMFQIIFGVHNGSASATPPTAVAPPTQWTQDTGTMLDGVESGDLFGSSFAWGNLDTSETTEFQLAVGAPGEDLGTIRDAGVVHILMNGCSTTGSVGLTDVGNELLTQDSPDVPDQAEPGDLFGTSLAVGAFSKHPTLPSSLAPHSLVVGVPSEDVELPASGGSAPAPIVDAGVVHVFPPGATSVTAVGSQLFRQGADGIPDSPESGDRFGDKVVATGINSDMIQDLAIGVPREDVVDAAGANKRDAGAVHVILSVGVVPPGTPTSASGLTTAGTAIWNQASVGEQIEVDDLFGAALAAAPVIETGGPFRLAIGVPNEGFDGLKFAGMVHVVRGFSGGAPQSVTTLTQKVGETAENNDQFGAALSAWRFRGGPTDLAVGAPGEDLTVNGVVVVDAGEFMLFAAANASTPPKVFTQAGLGEGIEAGDMFGSPMY